MKDEILQQKLNQMAALANELEKEAKRRYGDRAFLFFEAEGRFHVMSGDSDKSSRERQKFIKFTSEPTCFMGCGAW